MLHSPETPKPRQLPCEAIYREGRFIGRVRVEAIRPTETGTAVDMVLLETLANWVCVPIALEDLKPVVGQRWTSTNNCRFRERIDDMMSALIIWHIDFREFILEDIDSFSKKLNSDLRSQKRFSAIVDRIERTDFRRQFMEAREYFKNRRRYRKPIRAKKITNPEITKNFDFDIFEEDGKIFRYINGYRKTMHLFYKN